MGIDIKSDKELENMRRAGQIVAAILNILTERIAAGMKTKELDTIAEREVIKMGAEPSFKHYNGYPASLCVSINEEIVHGIPGDRVIKDGDIVSLDFGAKYNGFHGDSAVTVAVGNIKPEAKRLIDTTRDTLNVGIQAARSGAKLGDVSSAIQTYAESQGYSLVREYTGHGIGRKLHEEPAVPNTTYTPYGLNRGTGPVLKKGMTLAVEPMLMTGGWQVKVAENHWTVSTADGGLSAHFEHTIAIDDDKEAEILTR
jgi:methionyl aminopeptidase